MIFTQAVLTMVLLGNSAAAWIVPFVALLREIEASQRNERRQVGALHDRGRLVTGVAAGANEVRSAALPVPLSVQEPDRFP